MVECGPNCAWAAFFEFIIDVKGEWKYIVDDRIKKNSRIRELGL